MEGWTQNAGRDVRTDWGGWYSSTERPDVTHDCRVRNASAAVTACENRVSETYCILEARGKLDPHVACLPACLLAGPSRAPVLHRAFSFPLLYCGGHEAT
ncbi:hypothetical protein GWI33_012002 [Rhynchophorus ferrugineus]|uniref:Uncharacterized protein n=1 Tax=Rhynchophorus ferrugineus TaxID=354439 RepID=A0A834MJW4_RHYFE|nr:hypothetical protein GWI33_012002 [Rhynchophorus ferrugineus]